MSSSEARACLAGRYELLGLIGVGGMGSVYRAHDTELDDVVAVKMLRGELALSDEMLARFRQEVKLARRVTHKNVARTFDIGEHDGEKFLTMEYVEGESLATALARQGPFGVARAVTIATEICAGLAAAHAAGVVHRDLKPDNVLLAADERVVLTDFGIARLVANEPSAFVTVGGAVGTPAYMAPEQVEGRPVDARVDIYAVGEILFEMLTGVPPWTGTSIIEIAAARLHRAPPELAATRSDAPQALSIVVRRAMARRPEDRFANVVELATALAGLTLPQASLPAPPQSASVVVHERVSDATRSDDKTIGVLPFRNAGPPEDAYLAEGLTEDLIDSLSAVDGVRVRPFASVHALAQRDDDPRALGAELGVQVVTTGSVRRIEGALRVNARIISVADGFQLWAGRFDKPLNAFLAVGDEIANAIGDALLVDRRAPARAVPTNPAALELYLRARHELKASTRDRTRRAIELFTEAVRLAPRDPLILSGFAQALVREVTFGENATAADAARTIVEDAVAIAPQMPEPHLALAALGFSVGDSESAARSLARALALGRHSPEPHDLLGVVLGEIGPLDRAAREMEIALALEPRFHHTRGEIARIVDILGDRERASRLVANAPREAVMATGFWPSRVRTLAWRRDVAEAQKLLAREGDDFVPPPARMLLEVIVGGRITEASEQALRVRLGTDPRARRRRAMFNIIKAEVFAYVGDFAAALDAMTAADDAGTFNVTWFERCPLLDPVREDPRFHEILRRTKERADRVRAALGA